MLDTCVDTTITNVRLLRCRYGIIPQQSNRTTVIDVKARGGRHAISPAYFSDGVFISNVRGIGNVATLDSHEAFEVHYDDVVTLNDIEVSNIRSCGGSITNSRVHSTSTSFSTQMQNISFVAADAELYTLHDFSVENVEWYAPQGFSVAKGRVVTIDNLRMPNDNRLSLSSGTANDVGEARVSNTVYDNSVNGTIRCLFNPSTLSRSAAVLNAGVYHIRPWNGISGSRGAATVRQSGFIFTDLSVSVEPRTISVRIFTDTAPFDNTGPTPYAFGIIKFTASLRHSNAGIFDIAWSEYHFEHKKVPTTAINFPTTASNTSGLTGQANETLALSITNITQSAFTSSSDGRADYVQFDLTMTSGRTNPQYSLMYDLTLLCGL